MRVISGEARGIKLETIEGLETRPTTDRVKEAVFSMIQNQIYDARCLDLFSGSGALGIELLSRGARKTIFVESNPRALSAIESNLAKTRLKDRAEILRMDVYEGLKKLTGETFDIIMCDPPYLKGHVTKTLEAVLQNQLLRPGGILIVEHDAYDDEINHPPNEFQSLKSKKYGKIGVTIFRRNE